MIPIMFDRSIQILEKTAKDARAFAFYATVITQSFFLLYHTLTLSLSYGFPWISGTLLALTAFALIFLLCTETPQGAKNRRVRRLTRISVRYAKHCVHIVGISMMLYSIFGTDDKVPAFAIILLVFAILAFLIQMIAEIVGFLCRRYFEQILAAALADTEGLRAVLDRVHGGMEAIKSVKERFTAIPDRAAEGAGALKEKIKRGFSALKRKRKSDTAALIEGEIADGEEKEATQEEDAQKSLP